MKNFPKFLEKQHKYFAEKVREGGKSRSYADVIHGSPMLGMPSSEHAWPGTAAAANNNTACGEEHAHPIPCVGF